MQENLNIGNENLDIWKRIVVRKEIPVILPNELFICDNIAVGSGQFGNVYKAQCRAQVLYRGGRLPNYDAFVAIKQLKDERHEKLEELEREALTLMKLRHENIVHFYGVSVLEERLSLVFEFMDLGDLLNYLRKHNPQVEEVAELPFEKLLDMAAQVSSALCYLCEENMVHRDIAARNCLLKTHRDNLIVKLSDFGMTRDLYTSDYYRMDSTRVVPLRWLPPECIIFRRFTTESDVWSFGVLLWEIFTCGAEPWYQFDKEKLVEVIKEGCILPKPDRCPVTIYEQLLLKCWEQRPADRITASQIKQLLDTCKGNLSGYCNLPPTVNAIDSTTATRETIVF